MIHLVYRHVHGFYHLEKNKTWKITIGATLLVTKAPPPCLVLSNVKRKALIPFETFQVAFYGVAFDSSVQKCHKIPTF